MLVESATAIPSSIWASMNSWFTPTVLFLLLNLMIGTIAFASTFSKEKQHQQQPQKHSHNDLHHPNNIARSPSVLQRLKSINFYSHYRSQEPQDSSPHHKQNPDSDALCNVENTYQSRHLETQAHYFFQHNPQENGETDQESLSHYIFEQTPEHNLEQNQTHFYFEEKDSSFDDFQLARKEKVEEENSEQSMDEVYSQMTGSHFNRTTSDTEPASGEIPTRLPARMRKSASLKSTFGHFEEEEIAEARRPATVREKGNAKVTDVDEEVDAKADDFINRFKQQLKLQRLDSIIRYKDMIGRASGGR